MKHMCWIVYTYCDKRKSKHHQTSSKVFEDYRDTAKYLDYLVKNDIHHDWNLTELYPAGNCPV